MKDAFSEEEKSNKLIALSDMSKENIAIIYARIEQDKIYDIYFSSNDLFKSFATHFNAYHSRPLFCKSGSFSESPDDLVKKLKVD